MTGRRKKKRKKIRASVTKANGAGDNANGYNCQEATRGKRKLAIKP
jgi:hypothetical protein